MTSDKLSLKDHRTGKDYEVAIEHETINAMSLREIKVNPTDFGMMTYDPAFKNTASCKSRITFIDGGEGILEYRGYDIDAMATKSNHLEAAYLTLNGELPTQAQFDAFSSAILSDMIVDTGVGNVLKALSRSAHPMGALQTGIAALGTLNQDSADIFDEATRTKHIYRLIAQIPVVAAMTHRAANGMPDVCPDASLGYAGNFLSMMTSKGSTLDAPDPTLAKALDMLFVLHIDHEQNCSTSSMRAIGSSHVNPYASLAGAIAALYGPLHGGANEAVLDMLREIGSTDGIPAFIERVKNREAKLMGFGHRVYKNYDPRAKAIKELAPEIFAVTGRNPLIDIARELERIALEDDFFASRKLFPNVDFYSGIIYEAMGFNSNFFTVLFAIARTVGWLSQWQEMLLDKDQKIARPRQIYLGERGRSYIAIGDR